MKPPAGRRRARGLWSAVALSALGLAFAPPASALSPAAAWERTLDRVAEAVVAVRVRTPRAFDTEGRTVGTATGFVVDAERGILLTNRHVVQAGPVVADGVFRNQEEVELRPLYRDPVHDFGFFSYDPEALEFIRPRALRLAPERARVGLAIRVVGNDAGERISILSGTLARLDREAPVYGGHGYSDFNTFYYQAASGTSGGSSGSPVVDVEGAVVALNAGGRQRAATSFYLPLDRVVRVLERLRAGLPVPRGTLQTIFRHQPYDELRRLGLRRTTEAAQRRAFPGATGALVVAETVPGGPGDGVLQPGDVLVRIDGEPVDRFTPLEARLDARVGETVRLGVERGGEPLDLSLRVSDLHALTPRAYLEMGGATLNELSYHQARSRSVPVRGVYLAEPGYVFSRAGVPGRSVIAAVDGEATPGLEAFEARVAALPHAARVPVRYRTAAQPRTDRVAVVQIERRWFAMKRCERDDTTGLWPCEPSPPPAAAAPPPPPTTVRFPDGGERPVRTLSRSLVSVSFTAPLRLDGIPAVHFRGSGLVVDAEKGLVVVDRDTVPVGLGDLKLGFAGSVEVPGRLVYLHPLHNFAVLAYDPALLGSSPVRSATLRTARLEPGDDVWLVGLSESERLVSRKTQVVRSYPLGLPLPRPPRFRDTNLEVVAVGDSARTVGGVLADRKGRVLALWASFSVQRAKGAESVFAGLPVEVVEDVVASLREGRKPALRTLGVELRPVTLAEARNRGLSAEAAERWETGDANGRRILSVERITAGTPAAESLREGDLLLEIDGIVVRSFRDVERASQAEVVTVRLARDGKERSVRVATWPLGGRGTERALLWGGALVQPPHRALAAQRGIADGGVYVAATFAGSPAQAYGLRGGRRVVEVDGTPTPDLDAFLAAIAQRPAGAFVRLRLENLDRKAEVITLRPDPHYWPTTELRLGEAGWERIDHESP